MNISWKHFDDLPPWGRRPARQFVIVEGHKHHSDVLWRRTYIGDAYIHRNGPQGYRADDIARLEEAGDMDPGTGKVIWWMPAVWPTLPDLRS